MSSCLIFSSLVLQRRAFKPPIKPGLKPDGPAAGIFGRKLETFLSSLLIFVARAFASAPAAHENRGPASPRGGRTLCAALVSETKPRKRKRDGT